jgi:hypothetical protein
LDDRVHLIHLQVVITFDALLDLIIIIPMKRKSIFRQIAGILLVPTSDDDLEQLLITRSPQFQAMLERSRQSKKAGRVLSHEDFWAEVSRRHENATLGED